MVQLVPDGIAGDDVVVALVRQAVWFTQLLTACRCNPFAQFLVTVSGVYRIIFPMIALPSLLVK